MKSKHPKIILLGNNSGNNLGDAAIMSSIMDSVEKELPDAEFIVPSVKPSFISENYGERYNVKAVDAMPWTGSLRLFGIPTMYHMAKSDVALICDGIIFGKKLFNPAFNFLITLILLLPWAKLVNCKLVCYGCGIGPFPTKISALFAKWLMNGCDLITLRDGDSLDLAKEIGVTQEMILTADVAPINPVSDDTVADEILASFGIPNEQKLLGINITRYLDEWLYDEDKKLNDKQALIIEIADSVKLANEKLGNEFKPLVFSTQPMDDDVCNKLADLLDTKLVTNSIWLSHDIQAVMKRCKLFMGMRVHSLYLSSAVGCPILGMIYAPKVRSYLKQLKTSELGTELVDIEKHSFSDYLVKCWQEKTNIQTKQQKIVEEIKYQGKRTVKLLVERFYSDTSAAKVEKTQPVS